MCVSVSVCVCVCECECVCVCVVCACVCMYVCVCGVCVCDCMSVSMPVCLSQYLKFTNFKMAENLILRHCCNYFHTFNRRKSPSDFSRISKKTKLVFMMAK